MSHCTSFISSQVTEKQLIEYIESRNDVPQQFRLRMELTLNEELWIQFWISRKLIFLDNYHSQFYRPYCV